MNIGEKLKSLREHYGYTQTDLSKRLDIPQRNISNWESTTEPIGILDYILKFCNLLNMPVAEFFIEKIEDLKKDLPDYITPEDAAILKVLNTAVDIKTRIEVKSAFVHIMKAILVQHKDRLGHMPELQRLFSETEYKEIEETILNKVAEKKD